MSGRHQHRVAHSAGKTLVIDFHDLKFMPVEMHRVRHRRLIDEEKLDALALGNWQRRRLLGPGDVIK